LVVILNVRGAAVDLVAEVVSEMKTAQMDRAVRSVEMELGVYVMVEGVLNNRPTT
jgi:hypothetical protein